KSTALFLLDFMTENCGQRPRCVAAVPTVKALHDRARAASMLVEYTLPGGGKIIDEGIAPREGEVVDQKPGGPDKFLGDDLDQRLKPTASRQLSSAAPRPKVSVLGPARPPPSAATT